MNAIKKIVMGFVVSCAATASRADTYYWFGTNPNGAYNGVFAGTTAAGANYGWSTDPNATKATVAHTVSADHDYVVPTYSTSPARYPRVPPCTFAGKTLKLIGTLPLGLATGTFTFNTIIGGEYKDQSTATIANWFGGATMEVDADFQIDAGKAIGIRNVPAGGEARNTILGTSANKITGAGSLMLAGSGDGTAYYEVLCDASGFTGTINVGLNGNPVTGSAPGPANFTFKLSCPAFGGTVTDLPVNTKNVIVNYDGLPSDKGLRVATTAVPAALKTKLYFWSSTADFTAKNFPLMTFPAGTGISTDDFTVYHRTTKDGTDKEAFADLGVRVNADDGSMTLVANFEGQTVNLNSWTTEPALSKTTWMVREDEPGAVTRTPVAKYGTETMTVTLNGQVWDGTMPTAVGQYTLTWSIAATESYTGISISREFEISEFVDPVNSPVRYLPAGGQYWKPSAALFSALDSLPAAGGIIELNADLMDTQAPGASDFTKPVVFRSSTHPDRAGQRFAFTYNTGKRVNGVLSVSNLVIEASNASLSAGEDTGFTVSGGGRLTVEKDVEFPTSRTLVNASGANTKVDFNGVALTNFVNTANAASSSLCVLSGGASLTIRPGTQIAGARRKAIVENDATSTLTLTGGAITNNVIMGAAGAAVIANGAVNVSGSSIVWDNTRSGAQVNILPTDASKVNLTGDLAADAKLGVSYGDQPGDRFGVRTAGNPGKAFVCDANEKLCGVAKSDGYLHWKSLLSGLTIFIQ